MISIDPFSQTDWASVWQIIKPVFRSGETYVFPPDISEKRRLRKRLGKSLAF